MTSDSSGDTTDQEASDRLDSVPDEMLLAMLVAGESVLVEAVKAGDDDD